MIRSAFRTSVTVSTLCVAAFVVGCSAPDRPREATLEAGAAAAMPADVQRLLREGTEAYRAGDYDAALEAYGRAADIAPDLDAGWFGIHLTQKALGNEAAAEAALERMQAVPPGAAAHTAPVDPQEGGPNPHDGATPNPHVPGAGQDVPPDPRIIGP